MSEKITEQSFWQKTKRFFEPVLFRKLEYVKYLIQQIIISFSGVLGVIFLEKIVQALSLGDQKDFEYILFIFLFLIIGFEVVIFLLRKWGWMNTLPYNIADIYQKYLGGYIQMNNNKVELLGTGKIIAIIDGGSKIWAKLLADLLENAIRIIVTVSFTVFMLGRINTNYVGIFVGLIIISLIIVAYVNKLQAVFRAERYEHRNIRTSQFVKVVMSKMEILQSNKFKNEMVNIYANTKHISNISIQMATYRVLLKRSAQFFIALVIVFLFYRLGGQVLRGEIELSYIVGISGALILMQRSITDAMNFYINFSKDFTDVEKLWNFFDSTPQIQGYEEGNTFVYKNGNIELKNLVYGYDENKKVFKDFSAEIQGGKITAFVGPSGGGKSTLVKLISGYIRADKGEIIIDQQNLSKTSLKSYYTSVGYLTQEPSVFDGSVRENLLYAVLENNISEEKLREIISLAHAEFIYDLPDGLDTEIGERGVKLSGGQKQRLAIAKIFLKDPKIIILDEPTSALDSMSEKKITEAMHNLFKGRTVLVIAHRLQTVKHADDIIVIESGRIIERGTHTSLIRKKGYYKEMLDLQSGF